MKTLLSLQTYLNFLVVWLTGPLTQTRSAMRSRQSNCGSKRHESLDDPFHNLRVDGFFTRNCHVGFSSAGMRLLVVNRADSMVERRT